MHIVHAQVVATDNHNLAPQRLHGGIAECVFFKQLVKGHARYGALRPCITDIVAARSAIGVTANAPIQRSGILSGCTCRE